MSVCLFVFLVFLFVCLFVCFFVLGFFSFVCFVCFFCLIVVVIYLSKAFDKVWKEGLLLKPLRAGVHGKMYKWLSDLLFNRTARVNVDGMISRQVDLREGVPPGA